MHYVTSTMLGAEIMKTNLLKSDILPYLKERKGN